MGMCKRRSILWLGVFQPGNPSLVQALAPEGRSWRNRPLPLVLSRQLETIFRLATTATPTESRDALVPTPFTTFRPLQNGREHPRLAAISRKECKRLGTCGRSIKFLSTPIDARVCLSGHSSTKRAECFAA